MMMNNTMKNLCKVSPGTIITGKWNKHHYKVIKELGYGANGMVYLAERNRQFFALKMSDNSSSITSEMNILKSFSKVQGSALGPSFVEADDWIKDRKLFPFYVMEYIEGESFLHFIRQKGHGWTGVLILQLLSSLAELHKNGWIFGDLKPENLIVTIPSYKIRCVDVGGTTLIGRSVKEFTEFFDRGYWGLGSRKAEPSYDLFAVAMVIINSAYPSRFQKKGESYSLLMNAVEQKKELHPYKKVIHRAVKGQYKHALEMRKDVFDALQQNVTENTQARTSRQTVSTRAQIKRKKSKNKGLAETIFLLVIVSILYGLYIYNQIM